MSDDMHPTGPAPSEDRYVMDSRGMVEARSFRIAL